MADDKHPDDVDTKAEKDPVDNARRRLLRTAVYVPPAVLGIISLMQQGCDPASCTPHTCPPGNQCHPLQGCNPHP